MNDTDQALQRLLDGNDRFVRGEMRFLHQDAARRREIAGAQHPFAVVMTCSDSRVVPTIVFDAGLGDLFVVRLAGNVAAPGAVASLEFAVAELGCHLVMVLGHDGCGAVHAALRRAASPGQIGVVTDRIALSCEGVLGSSNDDVETVVRENIRRQTEELRTLEPVLAASVREGRLRVVGARYDLLSGRVDVIA